MYLIDVYRNPYAGTESQLYSLITDLDRTKINPSLTLFRESEYITKQGFPCETQTLGVNKLFSFNALKKMLDFARQLKKQGYHLVHIYFNDASMIAPVFLKMSGIRVIVSRRDMGFWYTKFNLLVLRFNRMFIDHIIANSEAVAEITRRMEYTKSKNISVIYNGFKKDNDENSRTDSDELRSLFNGEVKIIGLVANIRPVKRIQDLIIALAEIRKQHPDAVVVVIGGGRTEDFNELIKGMGLQEHVKFVGERTDSRELMMQFDVAVSCSESEGFSNVLVEYMSNMIPVVCTDVGGNPELIINNSNGYLVPVANPSAISKAVCHIFANPGEVELLVKNAASHVRRLCDQQLMLDKHVQLYNKLVQA